MAATLTSDITEADFRRLHPAAVDCPDEIRSILERLVSERVELRRGMNRKVLPETARLKAVQSESLLLETTSFDSTERSQVFLNFFLDARPYFFAVEASAGRTEDELSTSIPRAVYLAERRDRERRKPDVVSGDPTSVQVAFSGSLSVDAQVADVSGGGLSVAVPGSVRAESGTDLVIRYLDGSKAGMEESGRVRHVRSHSAEKGWREVGVDLAPLNAAGAVETLHAEDIVPNSRISRLGDGWKTIVGGARVASKAATRKLFNRPPKGPALNVLRYEDRKGHEVVALVDSTGSTEGAPAVIIPPAWGRTKETLLPLALAIVATFRAAGQPVVVVRFDGVRKRGESYNDPEYRRPGLEHHRFSFSQGVQDIIATLDFLERSSRFSPSTSILVTFSASSIEGRRAVALEGGRRLGGWVSVVGSADLQSMMRVISGGVDFLGGVERGVRFGLQEILGVEVDMDYAALDAIEHSLAFIADSRRDLASMDVPVTWFHGKHDAWMDPDRVRDTLSFGNVSQHRFVEMPTGHQLKNSREALDVFKVISSEVSWMATGQRLRPALPPLVDLADRQAAERARKPKSSTDVKGFWHRYLVGRPGSLGIELMTSASAYRGLMSLQIEKLSLKAGDTVADLGSGTGPFPIELALRNDTPAGVSVDEYDYVAAALERARSRLAELSGRGERPSVRFCLADLGGESVSLPAAGRRYDAVLASLLLGYVTCPVTLLREIARVLKPGGRLVLSTLRQDADISKIFADGSAELRAGRGLDRLSSLEAQHIDKSLRAFLNDAARLLDLEEAGVFRFWEPRDLERLVRRAGFEDIRTAPAFGSPPQAIVLSARLRA